MIVKSTKLQTLTTIITLMIITLMYPRNQFNVISPRNQFDKPNQPNHVVLLEFHNLLLGTFSPRNTSNGKRQADTWVRSGAPTSNVPEPICQ